MLTIATEKPRHMLRLANIVLNSLRLLLANYADVDAQDKQGNIPLFRTAFESRGRGEAIRLHLAAGADRKTKNKYGVSPEELANTIANYDVKQFLGG